jgi:Mor family transcriptional regulator
MTEYDDLAEFVCTCLNSALSDAGIDAELARSIAQNVEEDVRGRFGGDRHYIRQISKERRRERNRSIIAMWKGKAPRGEIAMHHDVDRRTVDRVISDYLAKQTRRHTGFGSSEWNL